MEEDHRFYHCVESDKKSPVVCQQVTYYEYENVPITRFSEFVVIHKDFPRYLDAFSLIRRYRRPVRVFPLAYP
jgi:hypothetical protein